MSGSALFELLERSLELFKDKSIVIAGDVLDPNLLKLVIKSSRALILLDNFTVYAKMAAMLGQKATAECQQQCDYKHVSVKFAAAQSLKSAELFDLGLILLSKNKQQTVRLLSLMSRQLKPEGTVFAAGENAGGGKSADKLLSPLGDPFKADSARKCTLFGCAVKNEVPVPAEPKALEFRKAGVTLSLKQDPAVFSTGRVDEGTALLLDALFREDLHGHGLDLGCGCGIVGLTLYKLGVPKITQCDVSVAALRLTLDNNALNGAADIEVLPSDMLSGLAGRKFDFIAVNPPFHQGLDTSRADALFMLKHAKEYLTEGGALYLVGNSFLHYERDLKESFGSVTALRQNPRFSVFKAQA